jgi:hypothetical protein
MGTTSSLQKVINRNISVTAEELMTLHIYTMKLSGKMVINVNTYGHEK